MSTEQLTAQFGWWGLASLAVTVPWSLVHARRAAPALGWAITDELVAFKGGWVWSQTTIAPFARVQAVTFRESPFDRRAAMAGVSVDTAGAGDLSHKVAIPFLARDEGGDRLFVTGKWLPRLFQIEVLR